MRAALLGAGTLLLVPAAEHPHRIMQHTTAVDAALAAGVERIVYLSWINASPDATFTLARHHWATEEHIRSRDVAFTFLRMSLYMDFIPSIIGPDGVIRGPAGDGRVAAILRADVAAAAAAVLMSDEHDGVTYDLTGREAFSLAEAAALLSRARGEEIRFENETDEEAFASRASLGAPDWAVEGWVSSYQAIRDGSLDLVSPDVRELTGRQRGRSRSTSPCPTMPPRRRSAAPSRRARPRRRPRSRGRRTPRARARPLRRGRTRRSGCRPRT